MELKGLLPHSQVSSILGQPTPVHIPTSHLLEIHPNTIHPSTPSLPSGLFPSGFPAKTLYTPLSSPIRATCLAHLILVDFITRTILGEQYKSFSSSLCNLLHSPVTSPLLDYKFLVKINRVFVALYNHVFFQCKCYNCCVFILSDNNKSGNISILYFRLLFPSCSSSLNIVASGDLLKKQLRIRRGRSLQGFCTCFRWVYIVCYWSVPVYILVFICAL